MARALTAAVCFAPFVHGVATGGVLYQRDLSSYFFPIRRYVVEGLRALEVRLFNPYLNEGVPLVLPPVGYPLDLLQAIIPNEWGFSLLLALHVPIAGLCFLALGRALGLGPVAATGAALVYGLCGFSLSCVNLYIHLQAFAWAPLAILLLLRAAAGRRQDVALAAVTLALCLSTTGVEIAAQAVVCAFALGASRRPAALLRFGGAVALAGVIAAAPLGSLLSAVAGSRRLTGFSAAEALEHSLHPASLLQVVVAGVFGDPTVGGYAFWGSRFWGGTYPYFLSLYLGGTVLCLATLGTGRDNPRRARLLLLLLAALVVCLGRFARLDLLLDAVPALARFRFPVKAFFTVVVSCALLAGAGLERLRAAPRTWRTLLAGTALGGAALVSLSLVEPVVPAAFAWLEQRLFLPGYPLPLRAAALRTAAADAGQGAIPLLAAAAVAALVLRRRVSPPAATLAVTALLAADLLRAGAGLNPTTHASFYTLSPEMSVVAGRLRAAGGRAFTCTVLAMPTFRAAEHRVARPMLWTAAVWRESLSPSANMDAGVAVAGADATALVAPERSLASDDAMCRDAGTLRRLRQAGVRFILSVQPFDNDALRLVDLARPARVAPLGIHVYELEGSLPDPAVFTSPHDLDQEGRGRSLAGAGAGYVLERPGELRVSVRSPREAYLILRRGHAPGWSATVDGRPEAIEAANARHQAVRVPAGASEVRLRYDAPRFRLGAAISGLGALAAAALWLAKARPA